MVTDSARRLPIDPAPPLRYRASSGTKVMFESPYLVAPAGMTVVPSVSAVAGCER